MINTNRIVPVTAQDLISLYSTIILQASGNSSLAKLAPVNMGEFVVEDNNAVVLATEPVKTVDIDATASSVSACTVFFVPAYDYVGFSIDGTAATPTGDVESDGRTLYKAVLSSGTITITKVGL